MSSIVITGDQQSPTVARLNATVSGATTNSSGWIRANNSTSAFIGFSAEL
jgi:hypothetical protein